MINIEEVAVKWLRKALTETDSFDKFVYAWFAFNALYSENMSDRQGNSPNRNSELDAILLTVQNHVRLIDSRKRASLIVSEPVRFFESRVIRNMRNPNFDTSENHRRLKNSNSSERQKFEALFKILYMVRCNLFHGNKLFDRDSDVTVIKNASDVLTAYLTLALGGMISS